MDEENLKILFNTIDFIPIFNNIHINYFKQKMIIEDKIEDYKKIIELFMKKYKINAIGTILKENNLLLELILELEEKNNLTHCRISKILGIGKNRITMLKKKSILIDTC